MYPRLLEERHVRIKTQESRDDLRVRDKTDTEQANEGSDCASKKRRRKRLIWGSKSMRDE
jgi:hypothetical protein